MLAFLVFIYSFSTFFALICGNPQEVHNDLKLVISPSGPSGQIVGTAPPILVRKVDDSLNLTCRLLNLNDDPLPNYNITWNWQYSQGSNANRVMIMSLSHNAANLVFRSLKEADSGEYTCKAVDLNLHGHVWVKVKPFKRSCSDSMFVCSNGNCIGRHYVCDGKPDCKFGMDEFVERCGPNPCEGKIPCDNGRCIPASWCCDERHDPNCTTKVKPKCCQQMIKTYPDIDSTAYLEHQFGDMGFLQTTIYTVIGCVMAFMFIVTILVIAICRVHLKRSISRCPLNHQHLRPGSPLRTTLPLYDLDMLLDRQPDNHGGLLVTYNINNGVQFVGRPIDPPPYCEIIDTPPREGPPPPYVSRENISTYQVTETTANDDNNDMIIDCRNETQVVSRERTNMEESRDISRDQVGSLDAQVQVQVTCSITNLKKSQIKSKLSGKRNKKIEELSVVATVENCSLNVNPRLNTIASSLGELSKLNQNESSFITNSYDICNSVPSVSGLNQKINNKNIKKNVLQDFSDSDDSSYLENDALLVNNASKKTSDNNLEEVKSNSNSFMNNIATVSKNFIGSFSAKKANNTSDSPEVKTKSDRSQRKNLRPLLTQKSFDSSDRNRKDLVVNNFDKIMSNGSHSLGDLSPVNSELNYGEFLERREFLTLPLRESFIGVRKET